MRCVLKEILFLLLVSIVIQSCSEINYPVMHHLKINTDVESISYTSDLRGTHVIKKNGDYWICMEPAPDAAFSYADEEDLSIALINIGEKGQERIFDGTEDLPLTGRVAYLLLARELNYRICEMAANTNASFEQYFMAYRSNLNVIKEIAKIEAKNIKNSTQVTVSTGVSEGLQLDENISDNGSTKNKNSETQRDTDDNDDNDNDNDDDDDE